MPLGVENRSVRSHAWFLRNVHKQEYPGGYLIDSWIENYGPWYSLKRRDWTTESFPKWWRPG